MPYKTIDQAVKKNKGLEKYSKKAQKGWISAFNDVMERDGDEQKAFAVAYSVANKIDGKKSSSDMNVSEELVKIARLLEEK